MGVNYYPVAPGWISNMIYKNVSRSLGSGEGGVHLCVMFVQSKNTWGDRDLVSKPKLWTALNIMAYRRCCVSCVLDINIIWHFLSGTKGKQPAQQGPEGKWKSGNEKPQLAIFLRSMIYLKNTCLFFGSTVLINLFQVIERLLLET